jgi:hypothetical protein
MHAADLAEEYVDFNKGDVTDASSLGGLTFSIRDTIVSP